MNAIKTFLAIAFLFSFSNSLGESSQLQQENKQIAQQYFENLNSFSTDFLQSSTNPINNQLQYFSGHLDFVKQNGIDFFRFEYEPPNQQTIIGNGQYIWMIDYDLEQVTRYSQKSLDIPIADLFSNSNFEWIQSRQLNAAVQNYFRVKTKKIDSADLVLIFKDSEIFKVVSQDSLENLVVFELSNSEKNKTIDGELFQFKNEKNFELVEVE